MNKQKSPCVLQDFVPFGSAALLPLILIYNHAKQRVSLTTYCPWATCLIRYVRQERFVRPSVGLLRGPLTPVQKTRFSAAVGRGDILH